MLFAIAIVILIVFFKILLFDNCLSIIYNHFYISSRFLFEPLVYYFHLTVKFCWCFFFVYIKKIVDKWPFITKVTLSIINVLKILYECE